MTRALLFALPLTAACWLGVVFVALCTSRGLLPALLLSVLVVGLYARVTNR